jgi:hypothetical protein
MAIFIDKSKMGMEAGIRKDRGLVLGLSTSMPVFVLKKRGGQ